MNLLVLNNPADLPWQTSLFDLALLTMFLSAVAYSVMQFRRGRRIYGVVLVAATIYGLVLELVGMATLDMYHQGDFPVMINWPAFALWHGTTMMPSYVLILYPVFLFTGFKVVEALRIEKRWQAAIVGGLFMISLDAPYMTEGLCVTSFGGPGIRISSTSSTLPAGRSSTSAGKEHGKRYFSTSCYGRCRESMSKTVTRDGQTLRPWARFHR
jgi:hypothetical protein